MHPAPRRLVMWKALLVVAALAAAQVCLASEDYDWSDPPTALWAIAREHAEVKELLAEAAEVVEDAAQKAKESGAAAAEAQIAEWESPVKEAAANAKAAGVDLSSGVCQDSYDSNFATPQLRAAVPLCVLAGRAQWDARLKRLQAAADGALDSIVKVQGDIAACGLPPGELLQAICRQAKVLPKVLWAQQARATKAMPPYWDVVGEAADDIPNVVSACIRAAVGRSTLGAETARDNAVACFEHLAEQRRAR